jgi:signal peptidase I
MLVAAMRETRRSAAPGTDDDRQRTAEPGIANADRHWAREWSRSFLIALVLFLFIRAFLVEAFRIPTGSMENTLLVGDFLLVNKAVYGAAVPGTRARLPALAEPQSGDLVVFVPPGEQRRNYVKRIVGVAGDTVAMHDGTLYRNGRPQEEPYARHTDAGDLYSPVMAWLCDFAPHPLQPCRPTRDNWGGVVVPPDRFFVLGDNRDDSEDSRYWGFVERAAVRGRPVVIYYSFDPQSPRPVRWLTAVRWDRIGRVVN